VLIVGYQVAGTLGRLLVYGARRVRIFDEAIAVRVQIHILGGFSAHAGQSELADWLAPMTPAQSQVVLTHGEERARISLAQRIATRFALAAELPLLNDVITASGTDG
jgi:metallo-beta-lactamase family protein